VEECSPSEYARSLFTGRLVVQMQQAINSVLPMPNSTGGVGVMLSSGGVSLYHFFVAQTR
jgi:hypothetical protein